MVKKQFFKKHHSRLVAEAILKSVLLGITVGLFANFLAALAAWFFDWGGIWFAIGVGCVVALVTGVILYFVRFRPTTQQIARRVDRLGLEERMITMLELQGDDSYIAQLQRENAREHLRDAENKKLRIRLPKVALLLAAVALILGGGMTTVVALAEQEIIPPGNELVNPEDPLAQYLTVTYLVEEGGEINGETDQLVLPGEDATPVVAVAEDGWMFAGWDDGGKNPERHDLGITQSVVYTAIFEEILESGEEGEAQEGQTGGDNSEGDKAEDLPEGGEANADNGQNGDGNEGSGSNSDSGESEGTGEGEEEGEGKGDGQGLGAGGKWEDSNQFIDGNTYYRDQLEYYYQYAQQIFEENGEIPPELREFFENYFGGI
jgi:hypothetical protein